MMKQWGRNYTFIPYFHSLLLCVHAYIGKYRHYSYRWRSENFVFLLDVYTPAKKLAIQLCSFLPRCCYCSGLIWKRKETLSAILSSRVQDSSRTNDKCNRTCCLLINILGSIYFSSLIYICACYY